MSRLEWVAGWHMPGCLPETPYEHFADRLSARGYLLAEFDRAWDDGTDEAYLPAHCELHNGSDQVTTGDGYVWEVYQTECAEDDCGAERHDYEGSSAAQWH